jgi:hypothetical protein
MIAFDWLATIFGPCENIQMIFFTLYQLSPFVVAD